MTGPAQPLELIIFDCDGTLVDSEYANNLATVHLLNEMGFPQYDIGYAYRHFMGRTLTNILAAIQAETGFVFPADMRERYIRKCRELQKEPAGVPGALETLSRCRGNAKICVASNGERELVLGSLKLAGFVPSPVKPDSVFTRNQVKQGKPAPDLFLFAASAMNADPSRCLVIEDSETGVVAGVSAGMRVWGFTGTSHEKERQGERLRLAGAEGIVDSLIHIADRLGF